MVSLTWQGLVQCGRMTRGGASGSDCEPATQLIADCSDQSCLARLAWCRIASATTAESSDDGVSSSQFVFLCWHCSGVPV